MESEHLRDQRGIIILLKMIGQNSKYAMVSKWSSWNTALVILSLFFLYIVHREGQDWPHSPPDSSQPIYQGGTSCHGPFSLLH